LKGRIGSPVSDRTQAVTNTTSGDTANDELRDPDHSIQNLVCGDPCPYAQMINYWYASKQASVHIRSLALLVRRIFARISSTSNELPQLSSKIPITLLRNISLLFSSVLIQWTV
jgi:hypothetical protein